jgi:hypothetical protein
MLFRRFQPLALANACCSLPRVRMLSSHFYASYDDTLRSVVTIIIKRTPPTMFKLVKGMESKGLKKSLDF